MDYKLKYFKYKIKYLDLKYHRYGNNENNFDNRSDNNIISEVLFMKTLFGEGIVEKVTVYEGNKSYVIKLNWGIVYINENEVGNTPDDLYYIKNSNYKYLITKNKSKKLSKKNSKKKKNISKKTSKKNSKKKKKYK